MPVSLFLPPLNAAAFQCRWFVICLGGAGASAGRAAHGPVHLLYQGWLRRWWQLSFRCSVSRCWHDLCTTRGCSHIVRFIYHWSTYNWWQLSPVMKNVSVHMSPSCLSTKSTIRSVYLPSLAGSTRVCIADTSDWRAWTGGTYYFLAADISVKS